MVKKSLPRYGMVKGSSARYGVVIENITQIYAVEKGAVHFAVTIPVYICFFERRYNAERTVKSLEPMSPDQL